VKESLANGVVAETFADKNVCPHNVEKLVQKSLEKKWKVLEIPKNQQKALIQSESYNLNALGISLLMCTKK